MKKSIVIAAIAAALLTACAHSPSAGTKRQLSADNAEIEVYQYFYDDSGNWVYVSRFKDQPRVETTTWFERQGKATFKKSAISINQ